MQRRRVFHTARTDRAPTSRHVPVVRNVLVSGALIAALFHAMAAQSQGTPAAGPNPPRVTDRDALSDGFRDPPASARPRLWWHWVNGNVTKEGIRKDLEWMERIGVGGVQSFDASLAAPQIVDRPLVFMTPEWKDAFGYAARLADEEGLELAIATSPGWSETGGPWVKPRDGMKKLVWSETLLRGGKRFSGKLSPPPATTGAFQDLNVENGLAAFGGGPKHAAPQFYSDVAVFAIPEPDSARSPAPHMRLPGGEKLDPAALIDDSYETGVEIAKGTPDRPAEIVVEYDRARTIRSASLFVPGVVPQFSAPTLAPRLEAQVAGKGWLKIADMPVSTVPTTVSFAPVTAKAFRIVLAPNPAAGGLGFTPAPGVDLSFMAKQFAPKPNLRVTDLRLSAEAKVNRFEAKAGFSVAADYYGLDPQARADAPGVAPDRVVNLTARMKTDGTLDWTPPKGSWRVVRLGYSLTGKTNDPASEAATGLEVDKYDGAAVASYLEHYLAMYSGAAGPDLMGKRGVRALVTDSIEVGASNWTPRLIEQFKRLRGYDPVPFLPTLTGVVIGTTSQSDAFLYDFRRTLADLLATEHYGTIARVAHAHGLKVYGEALEGWRSSLGDDVDMRRYADVPMAALWTFAPTEGPRLSLLADMKGASSTANFYGQNVVAAESMTSAMRPWADSPADLRRIVDLEFAHGVNLPVIHTSVHQPVDDKMPGLSLMIFGQYFTRHETWAEMARPWIDYIARTGFLLQQGRSVADLAYFYGEEAPIAQAVDMARVPRRHGYDFISANALLHDLKVENGELVSPGGARYRAVFLGGTSRRMTLPVLRKIAELAAAGAVVIGQAPEASPSLADSREEFALLVKRLWPGQQQARVGRGWVIPSADPEAALSSIGLVPDFDSSAGSKALFVHRRLVDGDVYFIASRSGQPLDMEARFRVTGKQPEIWRADSGQVEPVSYAINHGQTAVPLHLETGESLFVVFRKPALAPTRSIAKPLLVPVADLGGLWNVAFEPGRGAPPAARLDTLTSLSEHADPRIRYFSGIATYSKRFVAPRLWKPGTPLRLDLGRVGDLAEVKINGVLAGTAWHSPFALDVGALVTPGSNLLEIRVANLWVNRLIGDAQPGALKTTFTSLPTYRSDAPLRPSGLLGPVRLLADGVSQIDRESGIRKNGLAEQARTIFRRTGRKAPRASR